MWAADRLSKNHHTFWLFTSTFPWSRNSTLWFWQFRTAQLRTHAKVIIIPVLFFSQLRLLHFVVVCSVVQLSSVILSWWFVVKQTPPSAPPVFISSSPPLSLQLTFFIRAEFLLHPVRVIPVQVGSYTKHVDAQVVQVELCEVTWPVWLLFTRHGPGHLLLCGPQLVLPGGERKKEHEKYWWERFR